MNNPLLTFFTLLVAIGCACIFAANGAALSVKTAAAPINTPPRSHFLAIEDLTSWTRSPGNKKGELVLTSSPLAPPLAWNELVVSWNAVLPVGTYLTVEARGLLKQDKEQSLRVTKFYNLGHWSMDATRHARQSVNGQADADGDVQTDTLILKQRGAQLQLRLTLGDDRDGASNPESLIDLVRFIGLCFLDNTSATGAGSVAPDNSATNEFVPLEPKPAAWGKTIAVPERFQGDYRDQGGSVWCSPTTVSMVLEYWSHILQRPELNRTVPYVAHSVHDPQWPGTGNWSFNVAFAGSFAGMRAYVSRLDDLSHVEAWIAAGVPVALSVDYDLLKGTEGRSGGHLVVCNGFTPAGDVIIADPGRKPVDGQRYRVFPRRNVIAGWAASKNTVYLIHPESLKPPPGF